MSETTTLATTSANPLGEISQARPAMDVFLDKHQMKLIVGAILLAVFAVIFVIYKGIRQSGEETAGELLNKAESLSELQGLVKNHEGTAAALSAKVLFAEKQWEDGQQDDAVETLRSFVKSDRKHPARPSAEASLAAKLWSQGKTDEAVEIFRNLTDDADSRHLAPYAWISLGDIEAGKGDLDAARNAYETVEKEFPNSSFAQEAMQRSAVLKAKLPVEIAAPVIVPEAKIIDDKESGDADPKNAVIEDMIERIKSGAGAADGNPLLLEQSEELPAE
ncbi:MAG: tetratricopeptide repeat protein [Armatimonadetes bacterium]|nr:tetratricopeptide repeat protein [Akkermansiaceae bacterium]